MSLPIIMHVNYCEQGQTIPEMCRKAVAWGFDGIEFRRVRRGVDETPEAYVDEVARSAEDAGLEHVLFGGPGVNLATEDAAERKAQVEEGMHFYRVAAERVKFDGVQRGGRKHTEERPTCSFLGLPREWIGGGNGGSL